MQGGASHMQETTTRRRNRFGKLAKQRGRPRKSDVIRDASGKSRGEKPENVMAVALAQPHRRSFAPAIAADQRAECEHGRYSMRAEITDAEYLAGIKYRDANDAYLAAIQSRDSLRRSTASGSSWSEKAIKAAIRLFDDASSVEGVGDHRAAYAISLVVLRDQRLYAGGFANYKRALRNLVRFFGIPEDHRLTNSRIKS